MWPSGWSTRPAERRCSGWPRRRCRLTAEEEGFFRDRAEAGRRLAALLGPSATGTDEPVVLGLARGGVPVAYEVALALGAPLDVFVVRKLGAPAQPELAMGAIARGGALVVNHDVVDRLHISPEEVDRVARREREELERRERAYREGRPPVAIEGRAVILVDDGLATGASMRVALRAVRAERPARVVVAVPVAPPSTCEGLKGEADDVVCVVTPPRFVAVGEWYADFSQTSDQEVRQLLAAAAWSG